MIEIRMNLCENEYGCEKLTHERARFSECLGYEIPRDAVWKHHNLKKN